MNFQVIAGDNRANGGGINTAAVTVAVSGTSGPFRVAAPTTNVTWFLNSTPTIIWTVSGSNAAPINTANVKITLSTDGGATYPIVIAETTPNDGSHTINSPNISTSQARIKVEAVGNIFFDVSDRNFSIVQSAAVAGTIAGRITAANGRGVANVYVAITGGSPSGTRVALTNTFGYFQMENVPFAQYTITPQPRKRITFSPVSTTRDHNNDALDVNFAAVSN